MKKLLFAAICIVSLTIAGCATTNVHVTKPVCDCEHGKVCLCKSCDCSNCGCCCGCPGKK